MMATKFCAYTVLAVLYPTSEQFVLVEPLRVEILIL
jgi:hypothetical protein